MSKEIFKPCCHSYQPFPGVIYDVIVEPPSVGSTTDENGHQKPVSKLKVIHSLIMIRRACL